MEGLKEIMNIKDVYLTKLINYYNSEDFKIKDFKNNSNFIIYKNGRIDNSKYHNATNPKNLVEISHTIKDDFLKFVSNLNEIFDIDILFYLIYVPKGEINFHVDYGSNRHILPLNDDNKFYNYECLLDQNLHEKGEIYDKMRKDFPENLDEFNEFFLNDCELNSIHNLKSGSVYTIGNSLHTFINGSNKNRVALVFEVNS
jgi:hypothetical protein